MSTSYFCYLLNWFSEAILCGDGRCYSEGPMRDGCGNASFNEEKRQGEFHLPEVLAGAGHCRDRSRVREDSAEQIVFLYDGESDMACPVGRQTLQAMRAARAGR